MPDHQAPAAEQDTSEITSIVSEFEVGEDEVFVTVNDRLIRVSDNAYPLNFKTATFPFPIAFGESAPLSFLQEYGYDLVYDAPRPEGDVVTEVTPVKGEDGKYYRTYTARPFSPEELAYKLQSAKDDAEFFRGQIRDELQGSGASFDFGGEFGTHFIQMRDKDRLNVLGLAHKALRDQDYTSVFCTENDTLIPVDASTITAISDRVLEAYSSLMAASWQLRELIKAADVPADVPTQAEMRAIMAAAVNPA